MEFVWNFLGNLSTLLTTTFKDFIILLKPRSVIRGWGGGALEGSC